MNTFEITFVVALVCVILWFIDDIFLTGKNLPPDNRASAGIQNASLTCPWRVPVLGSLALYRAGYQKESPLTTFLKLCNTYGSIVTIKLGFTWQVIVGDPESVKEILTGEDWIDRPYNPILSLDEDNEKGGILFASGESWKELRRFSIRTLRDFGFGKQKSQEVIMEEELTELMSGLDKSLRVNNNVVNMNQFFTVSVLNILWSMVAGVRFAHTDPKLQQLLEKISILTSSYSVGGNLMLGFPFFRHILKIFPTESWKNRVNVVHSLRNDMAEILQERRKLGFYKEKQGDFIDVFLTQIDKQDGAVDAIFTGKQFTRTVVQFFITGSETTSNTCEFIFLYMILNPDVQRRVQAEIDAVVGRSRFPTAADRSQLPYTHATILEVQRLASIVPMIPRSPTKDVRLGKYTFKKGAFVIADAHYVHMDPTVWDDPHKFKPQRFLDSNDRIINTENLLAFGGGKRLCLGEVLARATLFTYFATFMQNYSFEASAAHPFPTAENPRFGLTLAPQPYFAHVKQRPCFEE